MGDQPLSTTEGPMPLTLEDEQRLQLEADRHPGAGWARVAFTLPVGLATIAACVWVVVEVPVPLAVMAVAITLLVSAGAWLDLRFALRLRKDLEERRKLVVRSFVQGKASARPPRGRPFWSVTVAGKSYDVTEECWQLLDEFDEVRVHATLHAGIVLRIEKVQNPQNKPSSK
jgi:hypothetical protein